MMAFSPSPCSRSVCIQYSKLDAMKTTDTHGKINAIWWTIKVNVQKLAAICGYELITNLQKFMQKNLTEVKIFQKVLGGLLFFETPGMFRGNPFRGLKYLKMSTTHREGRWRAKGPERGAECRGVVSREGRRSLSRVRGSGALPSEKFEI